VLAQAVASPEMQVLFLGVGRPPSRGALRAD